jgi:type II secretory pathway component PulC
MGFRGSFAAWALCLVAVGAPGQPAQPLPRTALPLALVGVIVDAEQPSNSLCLIRCAPAVRRARTLGPGENACDVAEVQEIRADAVVIRNLLANRTELLPLQGEKPEATAPAPVDAPAPASSKPEPPPPSVRESSDVVTIDLQEETVAHYLANLPDLLGSARATPRFRSTGFGQQTAEGFEIDQVRPGGIVEQMGLRNGDVILELNGQPLDSLASAIRLFGEAQGMAQSRMTVLRNGQRRIFVLNRKRDAP